MTVQELISPNIARRIGEYLGLPPDAMDPQLCRQDGLHGVGKRLGELLIESGQISRERFLDALYAQRTDRLRAAPLFSRLTDAEIRQICPLVMEVSLRPGQEFIEQDTTGYSLFLIASGRLLVYRRDDGGDELPLSTAWPGETIGEMGYFSDGMRSASARAIERSELLEIFYADLPRCFEISPNFARGFLSLVTERLRETNLRCLGNLHRRRMAERSLRHFNHYLGLSGNLPLWTGIEELFKRVAYTASRAMNADRASLYLLDPATGDLWSKVAEGDQAKEARIAQASIPGQVVQSGELVNIPDAHADPRFNKALDAKNGYRTRSILCGPVRNDQGQIVGVIQVMNKSGGPFNEADEAIFRVFTSQAAIAVENFNLYRRLAASHEKMAIMLDVATTIAQTFDLAALIDKIVSKTIEVLGCDRARFFLYDRPREELWSIQTGNGHIQETRSPALAGPVGHCATAGEVLHIRDTRSDQRFGPAFFQQADPGARVMLCVPVPNREGQVVGVVQAIKDKEGPFDDQSIELLHAICSQIGAAVENATHLFLFLRQAGINGVPITDHKTEKHTAPES